MRTHDKWKIGYTDDMGCCLALQFNKKTYTTPVGIGRDDEKHVFRDGTTVFLLNINYPLEYVGLKVYEISMDQLELEEVGDVFLQYDWSITEALGKEGLRLMPINIAKKLAERV